MASDSNLNEIRNKIYQLRTAIMYSMSNELCKLPNSIVTALQVDDEGQLWFVCPRPLLGSYEDEQSFPVRLHFYRKGFFFHLEVSGKATITNESAFDELPGNIPEKEKLILIRMTMNSIECTEPYEKRKRNKVEIFIEQGYNWMLRHIAIPHSISKNAV